MPEKTLKEKVECPFCREKRSYMLNVIADGNGPSYMWCSNCLSAGPEAKSAEEALEKWNTRPALTALEERNERLWVFIRRIEDRFDEHDLWRDNKDLLETYEELRKEAPDGK